MQHFTGTFAVEDNVELFTQSWVADAPKAAVLITHGYAEHSSRYLHVAQTLTANGYSVYTYDLRGHGKSPGRRAFVKSFDEYILDLEDYVQFVRHQIGELPLFLLGHSMGGAITSAMAIAQKPDVKGILLSAPALVAGDDISGFMIAMSRFVSWAFPKLPAVKLGSESISRDPAIVKDYDNDPLNYRGGMPARLGAEMLRTFGLIEQNAHTFEYPMIVMQGTADQIVNPIGSQQFYDAIGSEDKTLKWYEGLYHEIMNEPEKEDVLRDIVTWLNSHI